MYHQPFPSDTKENRGKELRYPIPSRPPINGFTIAGYSWAVGSLLIIGAIAFFGAIK